MTYSGLKVNLIFPLLPDYCMLFRISIPSRVNTNSFSSFVRMFIPLSVIYAGKPKSSTPQRTGKIWVFSFSSSFRLTRRQVRMSHFRKFPFIRSFKNQSKEISDSSEQSALRGGEGDTGFIALSPMPPVSSCSRFFLFPCSVLLTCHHLSPRPDG